LESYFENVYKETDRAIEEKGYTTAKEEKMQELIQLFKEMLEYKNIEYDDKWNFKEWIDVIDTNYHYFHDILRDTSNSVTLGDFSNSKDKISRREEIIDIIYLRNQLSDKENGYKEYAHYYDDIKLKEGQTYEDLYKLEKEKYIKLFKEMLDFVNVKYDSDYFDNLSAQVALAYPYYSDTIIRLDSLVWSADETYISIIHSMRSIYKIFSEGYKNHEQNMKEYKEAEDIGFFF
jgi:hypothetical protein